MVKNDDWRSCSKGLAENKVVGKGSYQIIELVAKGEVTF